MNPVLTLLFLFAVSMAYGQTVTFTRCDCYKYSASCGSLTWEEAKATCESEGGFLATMDTEETWRAVKTEIVDAGLDTKDCHNNGFWIGYHDRDTSLDNIPHAPSDLEWIYPMCKHFEIWEKDQPDDSLKKSEYGQNCVQLWIRKSNKFDDDYCTNTKGYVCQRVVTECSCAAE